MFKWPVWIALVWVAGLSGCATTSPQLRDYLPSQASHVELVATPFIAQEAYQCGPASLAMLLQDSGVKISAAALKPRVYIPQLKGSLQAEMLAATRDLGRMPYPIAPRLDALLAELRLGRPVLVLQNLGFDFYPVWHYAVVVGYDAQADHIILRSGTTRRKLKPTWHFLRDWSKSDFWGVAALLPGTLPADASAQRYLEAAASLESAGKTQAARLAYASAVSHWPEQPAGWLGLGNVQYAEADSQAAIQTYKRALNRLGNIPVIHNNLAQVLADQGCKQAASKHVKLALQSAPQALRPAILDTQKNIEALPGLSEPCEQP